MAGLQAQNRLVPSVPGPVSAGHARPYAMRAATGNPADVVHGPGQTSCGPSGNICYYIPSDVLTAYAITHIANSNGGAGMTVAIVDAFYNSETEADLVTYSTVAGLPSCTIANECLTIVSQTGGSPSGVSSDEGWAQETDLDVQTVHAIAPNAKILLVATNSNSFTDLGAGVTYARTHSNVISNSYGAPEFDGEATFDSIYTGSPVPILFSSGDTGAVVQYPCASIYVACIGGTHLLETATAFRNIESVWGDGVGGDGGAGSGCSIEIAAPSFQTGFNTCGSSSRGVPDISALADPYTGFIVFLGTFASGGSGNEGFYIFGGTSLACPLTAAIVANIDTARVAASKLPLGGNLNALLYQAAANPYYRYRFYDVSTGSNGLSAGTGWDFASGLGVALGPALASYLVGLP
jgi:subtilase family serine protease